MRQIAALPTLTEGDDARFADATVPGEVHVDLVRAGIILEPSEGRNSLASRWVEEAFWWYRRAFDAVAGDGARTWLVFEQLDLNAVVYLNGDEVAQHRNSFHPLRVEITDRIRTGSNDLAVRVDSGVGMTSNAVPPFDGNPQAGDWGRLRVQLRKPAYQFSWDWATRMLTVGIGGDVYLERTAAAVVVHSVVPLVDVTPDLRTGTVEVRVRLDGLSEAAGRATIRAGVAGVAASTDVEILTGEHEYALRLEVPDPELWWPNGHGEQVLHDLEIEVTAPGIRHSTTKRIGFRRVVVDESPHPVDGRYFVMTVNNRRIFCKGSNLAPLDMIPIRVENERYDRLIALALEAGMVYFRINGVGIYESDYFYELCDRYGLMVAQDFALSVAIYPAEDRAFLDSFYAEATHQVRRLASHPSLVMWCGCNESLWIYHGDGRSAAAITDLHLYQHVIPQVLANEDPTRHYIPCSPHSPMGVHPNDGHVGDQHSWEVGMGWSFGWDFRGYRTFDHRFSDEAGIMGPPSLPTMRASAPDVPRALRTNDFAFHDNTMGFDTHGAIAPPTVMVREWLGLDPLEMTLEEYAYWGGLLQAEGLREYVDNFRRRMFDSAAACTWNLNDCWPTTRGWTVIDYYLRRTPGFWGVKRAMAPVTVVVAQDDDVVNVYGVNDTTADVTGELDLGFFRTSGPGTSERRTVTLASNASTLLASLGSWDGDPATSIAFAALSRPGHSVARHRLVLPLFRELAWAPAAPAVHVENGEAVFESDTFAWGVCLDLSGEVALHDNFFDVWPGVPFRMPWAETAPPTILHVGNLVR
jgi:beta-mannosidase